MEIWYIMTLYYSTSVWISTWHLTNQSWFRFDTKQKSAKIDNCFQHYCIDVLNSIWTTSLFSKICYRSDNKLTSTMIFYIITLSIVKMFNIINNYPCIYHILDPCILVKLHDTYHDSERGEHDHCIVTENIDLSIGPNFYLLQYDILCESFSTNILHIVDGN